MSRLEAHLRARRDAGGKLLLPYVTGGWSPRPQEWTWPDLVRAFADAGADAIEIGIPFSDPVMDGPTIQAAGQQALDAGATPTGILDELRGIDAGVPLAVMTYANIAYRSGFERFAAQLADAGVDAAILPDIPLEEVGPWAEAADAHGIETVLLAAPTAPDERLPRICARTRGFVYAVGVVGITGERSTLAPSALEMARRLKAVTDVPVVVGIGVSNADQAAEICEVADGVVMASAIIRELLEGASLEDAARFVADVRARIDGR
jgi:tryptophan synthase alpha chain